MRIARLIVLKALGVHVWSWGLLAVIAIGLGLNVLLYVDAVADPAVQRDQWRILSIAAKWFDGSLRFEDLWSPHGAEHRILGYKLIFLANTSWFGLQPRIESFLGVAAMFASAVVLFVRFRETLPADSSGWAILGFALPLLILLSLNQQAMLGYGLSIALYIRNFLFFLTMVVWDRYLLSGRLGLAAITSLLSLCVLAFGGGTTVALIAAIAIVTPLAFRAERIVYRTHWASLGIVLASVVALQWLYWSGAQAGIGQPGSLTGLRLAYLLEHPLLALWAFFAGLAAPLSTIRQLGAAIGHSGAAVLGMLLAAVYVGIAVARLRGRSRGESFLPELLIAYGVVNVALVVAARLLRFDAVATWFPRYTPDFQFALVGLAWVVVQRCPGAFSEPWTIKGVPLRSFPIALIVLLLAGQIAGFTATWKSAAARQRRAGDVHELLMRTEDRLSDQEVRLLRCPNRVVCLQGIEILRRHRLNVFAE